MNSTIFVVLMTLVGAGGGLLAWRVAERVLADRDDYPGLPARWSEPAAIVAGAAAFGLFTAHIGDRWLLVPYLFFVLATLAMTFTDLRAQLIPDRISVRSLGIGAALLLAFSLIDGSEHRLDEAFLGALISAVIYFVIYIAGRGRSFGFGDVKLSPLIGMYTAFSSWGTFALAIVVGFLIGGLAGLLMLVSRLKGFREHFAFGPAMVVGAYVALLFVTPILDWYLSI